MADSHSTSTLPVVQPIGASRAKSLLLKLQDKEETPNLHFTFMECQSCMNRRVMPDTYPACGDCLARAVARETEPPIRHYSPYRDGLVEEFCATLPRLEEFRKREGMSRQRLADLVGVTYESIWRHETGRSPRMYRRTAIRIAEVLGVDLQLLEGPAAGQGRAA